MFAEEESNYNRENIQRHVSLCRIRDCWKREAALYTCMYTLLLYELKRRKAIDNVDVKLGIK